MARNEEQRCPLCGIIGVYLLGREATVSLEWGPTEGAHWRGAWDLGFITGASREGSMEGGGGKILFLNADVRVRTKLIRETEDFFLP